MVVVVSRGMVDVGADKSGVRMEWRPAGWLVSALLLLVFPCTIKSRRVFLWHRLTQVGEVLKTSGDAGNAGETR